MQLKKLIVPVALASGALLVANVASAAQVDSSFNVKVAIAGTCKISTIEDIDFGTVTPGSEVDELKSTTLKVQCNHEEPFTIALKPGNSNTVGAGAMISSTDKTVLIAYQLYSDGAASKVWGSVTGTGGNVISDTSTRAVQSFPIYAKLLAADVVGKPAGYYNDVVAVNVTY